MILVTGSTGLVGTHLIQQLLQNKQPIKAFFRSEIPFEHSLVQWVKADILDVVALEEAMQNVTQVYHCAAIVSFNPKQKNELHKTNIEGTANVVNACLNAQVQKLLFVSSVAALGRIREDKPIDETMNWTEETSNSEYGKTKFLAEMEVWRGIGEGLNAVIVNPTIILGNGDWNKGSSSVFKSVYNEFPWYTEGTTGFVDVLDVVEAMIQLMNSNIVAQRFILSAETSTYKNLFTLIAKAFNKKPPSKLVTPFIAAVVWRLEAFKAKFSGKQPLLTKETAKTAQAKVSFNNQKLLQYLPSFSYTSLPTSIQRICKELKQTHGL